VEWLLLGLGVLLTVGTAICVASEFSLVALDRPTVADAVSGGDRRARPVLHGVKTLSTQLSSAQVGITVTTLLLGFLAQPSLAALLTGPLRGLGLSESAAGPVAVGLALLLATLFSILIGELVPKNLAIAAPLATAKVVVPLQLVFTVVAKPLIVSFNATANAALRAMGVEPSEELPGARTPDELSSMVRRSAELGMLPAESARHITRSLDLGTRVVEDIATPRTRTVSVRRACRTSDIIDLARRTGHSRFLVIDEDIDNVVGVVHVKRAIAVPFDKRGEVPAGALMTQPARVPTSMRLPPLLAQLRDTGLHMALVVDEYGGTAGIVTLEDIVEEIIGDVTDEHDLVARASADAAREPDGSWSISGLLRPDEVTELTAADVPEDPSWETLGGFVMSRLGRVPAVGDSVEVDGGRLVVAQMDRRRVDRVRFIPEPREAEVTS